MLNARLLKDYDIPRIDIDDYNIQQGEGGIKGKLVSRLRASAAKLKAKVKGGLSGLKSGAKSMAKFMAAAAKKAKAAIMGGFGRSKPRMVLKPLGKTFKPGASAGLLKGLR